MFHLYLFPVLLLPLLPHAAHLHPLLLPHTFFISRRLAAIGARIDALVTTKFPRASQEEREETRRQLRRAVLHLLEDMLHGTSRMARNRWVRML